VATYNERTVVTISARTKGIPLSADHYNTETDLEREKILKCYTLTEGVTRGAAINFP
jgi:hypothetical protein